MKKLFTVASLLLLSSTASAERAPAPYTMVMVGGDTVATGQAGTFGVSFNKYAKLFWQAGACTDADSYAKCDLLRFGLSAYPGKTGTATCNENLHVYHDPMEDGGDAVETTLKTIQNDSNNSGPLCADGNKRPMDQAQKQYREKTFPNPTTASDPLLQLWWSVPRINLMVINAVPQKDLDEPDDRVKKTLQETCKNLDGAEIACAMVGGTEVCTYLPSLPTWAFMFRKADEAEYPFGQLLTAAGGSGVCCYGAGCDRLDDDEQIDVCSHIEGYTDAQIRTDLADGIYNCGAGLAPHQTGLMGLDEEKPGHPTGNMVDCFLVGDAATTGSCPPESRVDILGIFSCVRQLPLGTSWQDSAMFLCPTGFIDFSECKMLNSGPPCGDWTKWYKKPDDAPSDWEPAGYVDSCADGAACVHGACSGTDEDDVPAVDFTWVDEKRTMFIMNDKNNCRGGDSLIEITKCPLYGQPCNVEGAVGRCSFAQYECIDDVDVCVSKFEPMPEICNGLDDDCTGVVDNMGSSWENFSYTLPSEFVGLDCRQTEVCRCPNGPDSYGGVDFLSYLQSWSGGCLCGEGVEAPGSSPVVDPVDPQASCANAATTPSAIVLILLGFFGLGVRRFARSRG